MKFDLIVIGSGPGGYVAAIRAAQLGFSTAIIEKEDLGGVCLNWGCIPTKALLKSAQVFNYLNHAEDYGFTVPTVETNFPAIIDRSRKVANKMNQGIEFLMKKNKITVLRAQAKILPNKEVETTDKDGTLTIYQADHIVLATGARSKVLVNLPQDGKYIIGYKEALALPKLPKSMCIVGSGAIGVEFAYFYNAMGVAVTLVEYLDRIVPLEDIEISKELKRNLKKVGITILTSTSVEKAEVIDGSVRVTTSKDSFNTDLLLSAVGITTNIENIGLKEVGIEVENNKIIINGFYQTSMAGYYAIGDIVSGPSLAHVASAEALICIEKIAGHQVEPLDYNNIPGCTYCSPEIASVGLTEEQCKENGTEIKVGKFPFSASGKATANGTGIGFVKVIFDSHSGEWLGCHMIGDGVTEMISEAIVARKLETTAYEIIKSVHPHPTLSEAIMEAVADAYNEGIHL